MKGIFKRGISLIITATMIMSVLTGCGKGGAAKGSSDSKDSKDENILEQASTQKKDYVFKSEDLVVEGLELSPEDFVSDISYIGDRVYCSIISGHSEYKYVSFDTDGGNLTSFTLPTENADFYKYESFISDGSGVACYYQKQNENDTAKQSIVSFDNKGNITQTYDCSKMLEEDDSFFVNSLIELENGTILAISDRGLETFSFDEGFKNVIEIGKPGVEYLSDYSQLLKSATDCVFVCSQVDNKFYVQIYDVEKGELSPNDTAELPGVEPGTLLFAGAGHDFYLSSDDAISCYDREPHKIVKLLDYLDSDLGIKNALDAVCALSYDEFIAAIPDSAGGVAIKRLTKVPADQVKEKKILTLASTAVDNTINSAVTKFNQENDEYKINLVEYVEMTDEDWSVGMQKLDKDIVSGNIPDIMAFGTQPIEKYSDKGLFVDLKPYYEKDKDKIELLPNVLKAMTTGDKMYALIPDFTVGTVVTKKKFTDGKDVLTLKDCDDLIKAKNTSYEIAFGFATPEDILGLGLTCATTNYIDLENKKCNFDSDSFIELLEFANRFPKELNYQKYESESERWFRPDVALFEPLTISGFDYFRAHKQAIFGEDIAFIGFPNDEGQNESLIYPGSRIAISAKSPYPDAAWEFLKILLDDEFQNNKNFSFPSTKAGYEANAKRMLEQPYDDYTGEKLVWTIGDVTTEIKPLTQEEIDELTDYILSVDRTTIYDGEIATIILEEAAAYFAGQKSAEEVAKIIQSRTQIYVSENG